MNTEQFLSLALEAYAKHHQTCEGVNAEKLLANNGCWLRKAR